MRVAADVRVAAVVRWQRFEVAADVRWQRL